MNVRTADLVIVGGGLVGLSLAAALKNGPWDIVVIDAGPAPTESTRSPLSIEGRLLHSGVAQRVSSINPAAHDFLSRIGGWPPPENVCAFTRMSVADARGSGSIDFDAQDAGEPALGYVVENVQLLTTLYSGLIGIECLYDKKIEEIETCDAGYRVVTADETFECRLLVGADGGNSMVRRCCNISTLSWPYPHDALVATVLTQQRHGHTARQWFTPEGPLALLPLRNDSDPAYAGRLCSLVWSSSDVQRLLSSSDEAFCAAVTAASEKALGDILAVDQRASFALNQQQVYEYVRPHLALIGDAAHTIHPLAGQGANLGLADAEALAQVLFDAHYRHEDPGSLSLLRRYQLRRQPLNVMAAGVMEFFARAYMLDSPVVAWLRNLGARWIDRQPPAKSLLVRLASGRAG